MKKMRMCFPNEKTFADGFAEYILDCKARNLRDGTIHHYQASIKQIYKRIPPNTPISSLNKQTMTDFYIALRDDPDLNEVSHLWIVSEIPQWMQNSRIVNFALYFPLSFKKNDYLVRHNNQYFKRVTIYCVAECYNCRAYGMWINRHFC